MLTGIRTNWVAVTEAATEKASGFVATAYGLATAAQPLVVYNSGALGGQKAYTSVNCIHENC
jgi:hypothetical protein